MNKVTEIRLVYRNKIKPKDRVRIKSSEQAFKLLLDNWDLDYIELQEEFKCILLNRANHVLGIINHTQGGTNGVEVDVRLLFAAAITANASGIIIAHNHPSGNMKPSQPDVRLTRRVVEIGKLLEIPLLDHLIVSPDQYYSFSDEGML